MVEQSAYRFLFAGACLALVSCSTSDEAPPVADARVPDSPVVDAALDASAREDAAVIVEPQGSAGCDRASEAYPSGTTAATLMHAGAARTFRVHVPSSYDGAAPRPLVLMLHGGGGSGRQFEQASSRMDPIADREGFIAVYPDGSGALKTWNGGGCCGFAVQNDVDDVGFMSALLDHLEGELCVDEKRVFASGMSNGAIMSHRLACELADRIAAIAPVAGTDLTASCEPARPVPVMHIHGTADGHVPWEGGEGCGPAGVAFTSVPDTIERWRMRDGCSEATRPYFEQGDGSCVVHEGCADGADLVLCTIEGGGHSWPGGDPPAGLVECPANGFQSATFLASEAVWAFFASHPLR